MIEAGFLNVPILSSNCPNGPDEIILNNHNGVKYNLSNRNDFFKKIEKIINLNKDQRYFLLKNMKKETKAYTQFRFYKNFKKSLNL